MDIKLLVTFLILSLVNVVFSTVRSIITIKGNKVVASLLNGGYFAFYNIMLIYTVADFPLWQKCAITFACNVIGVFIVKLIEEKMRKDQMWQIRATIEKEYFDNLHKALELLDIPHNYIDINKYFVFDIYSATQKDSVLVKELLTKCNAKYFVTESKIL